MLVALIGQPNSGKSALLARLTGARVVTSNYPGTTVEVLTGTIRGGAGDVTVLDAPGIYSLAASSREQEIAREIIAGRPDLIVNVVDATNLGRHLALTLQLLECGAPLILALNSSDRLSPLGLSVDARTLSATLGVPVILTSALTGEGVEDLKRAIAAKRHGGGRDVATPGEVGARGDHAGPTSREARIGKTFDPAALRYYHIEAERIALQVVRRKAARSLSEELGRLMDTPAFSLPVLSLGLLAAWKAVAWAVPLAEAAVRAALRPVSEGLGGILRTTLPEGWISQVLAEAIPEGIVLPLATVLPAMIVAYTLIALLEDSGLLGRYAALGDVVTGHLNLPGQALIPFLLAFGCRVPAILSVRILPSEESRRSASIAIATVVPCAATVSLGLTVLARFGGNPLAVAIAVSVAIFVVTRSLGLVARRARDPLVLELPPLRFPIIRNVLLKTNMRLAGFFSHVLPLLVMMNVCLRLIIAGGLPYGPEGGLHEPSTAFARLLERGLGIPPAVLGGVALTLLQRYLAPLFLLQLNLSGRQATIAVTMVAMGLPCLPSAATLWREMGPGAVMTSILIGVVSSLGGAAVLNLILP